MTSFAPLTDEKQLSLLLSRHASGDHIQLIISLQFLGYDKQKVRLLCLSVPVP